MYISIDMVLYLYRINKPYKAITMTKSTKPVIKRIYISRGDKHGKFLGLVIGKSLYWYFQSFKCPTEINNGLHRIGVHINKDGDWGVIENYGVNLTNKASKIAMTHDRMFSEESSYGKRAKDAPHGDMFWSMSQILESLVVVKKFKGAELIKAVELAVSKGLTSNFDFGCTGQDNEPMGSITFPIAVDNSTKLHFHIDAMQEYHGDYDTEDGYYKQYSMQYKQLHHITIKQDYANRTLTATDIEGYQELNQYLDGVFDGMSVFDDYDENRYFQGEFYRLKKVAPVT